MGRQREGEREKERDEREGKRARKREEREGEREKREQRQIRKGSTDKKAKKEN